MELRANADLATGSEVTGTLAFFSTIDPGEGNKGADSAAGDLGNGYNKVFGRKNNDNTHSVFINGLDKTANNETKTGDLSSSSNDFALGGLPNSAAIPFTNKKVLDIGWNKTLLNSQIQQLNDDSFGPFCMADEVGVVIAAAAAGFVPYPNPRYALTGGMQPMAGGT